MRTLLMTVLSTVVAILIALPLAYVMTRTTNRWVRLVLLVTMFLPILTGDIARAYGWLVLLGREGLLSWVIGGDPGDARHALGGGSRERADPDSRFPW